MNAERAEAGAAPTASIVTVALDRIEWALLAKYARGRGCTPECAANEIIHDALTRMALEFVAHLRPPLAANH